MLDMKRGLLERIGNLDKRTSADSWYLRIVVKNERGELETLLFTEESVAAARERTKANPEDEAKVTWIDKVLRILGKQPPLQLPPTHSEK